MAVIWILAAAVACVWLYAVIELGALLEVHHFWYGAALLPFAGLRWLGLVIMADDAYQHARQLREPGYRSPLWHLGRVAFYEPLARLRSRLDREDSEPSN